VIELTSSKGRAFAFGALMTLLGLAGAARADAAEGVGSEPSRDVAPRTAATEDPYARLPLGFEANHGQTDSHVDFLARGAGYAVFLTSGEAVLALKSSGPRGVLRVRLVGADATTSATGLEELPGRSNYLKGNDPALWRIGLPTFARVRYASVYPGVDVVYYGNQRRLEYDFVVAPGADPRAIALAFGGADGVQLQDGELVLRMAGGEVRQLPPHAYQEVAGVRQPVAAEYELANDGTVRFRLGAYDVARPLIIDPTLAYGTFLGGTGEEFIDGMAVDPAGNVYASGETFSAAFPTTAGAFQRTPPNGDNDAFVTKINPAGTALVYSTYLGGNGLDHAHGIAVDRFGNAYVLGSTLSTNFPVQNAFQNTIANPDNRDVFLTKLNLAGSGLVYSTYLGGNGGDVGEAVAVDGQGRAHVTGLTLSSNFPVTPDVVQGVKRGGRDVFVTKFNANGNGLLFSTFFGGSTSDVGEGIAVDAAGNVTVVGTTFSSNFPKTRAFDATYGGSGDAFVFRLNPTGSGRIYSTFVGGALADEGLAVGLDGAGNAILTGFTESDDFPTQGGFQTSRGGGLDAFVAKLRQPTLTSTVQLAYGSYLGGLGDDIGFGIGVEPSGRAYVTGTTSSPNFPTRLALQAYGGGQDAFVAGVSPTGNRLGFSTPLGGIANEEAHAIAIQGSIATLHLGGVADGGGIATAGSFDNTYNGGPGDAFVVKILGGTDVDDDQLPDIVEIEEGRAPNVKDNDVFASARLFSMQQYRDFLGREGDEGGIDFWTSGIQAGTVTRAQVVVNFLNAPEFQSRTAPITRLYFAFFLRIPDFGGLTFWTERFQRGLTLQAIAQAFATSAEFQNRYGTLTNAQFVDQVYQNVLERAPDPQGRQFWIDRLNAGLPRGAMMVQFSESDEFKTKQAEEVLVTQAYVGMLERSPEQGGFDFWVGRLEAGASPRTLIEGFLGASEYRQRFLAA